ncbi:hypothetical protein ACFLXE_05790 [Chloroflexota bacterium]
MVEASAIDTVKIKGGIREKTSDLVAKESSLAIFINGWGCATFRCFNIRSHSLGCFSS